MAGSRGAGGIQRYTREMVSFLSGCGAVSTVRAVRKGPLLRIPTAPLRRATYLAALPAVLAREARGLGPKTVLHFTNYYVPPLRPAGCAVAVTVHDLAAFRYPETLPPLYRPYLRQAVRSGVRRADVVFTLSAAVRRDVVARFRVDASSVVVAPLPVPAPFRSGPDGEPRDGGGLPVEVEALLERYEHLVLFVGTVERRKNLDTLLDAFASVAESVDACLVLAGRPGFGYRSIRAALDASPVRGRVRHVADATDAELVHLLDRASALVLPSRYEGFGIPLVEAMSRGTPVVASEIDAAREVGGDAALIYGEPSDAEALAGALVDLCGDPSLRAELGRRGLRRARRFTWERAGPELLEGYRRALEISHE